MEIEITKPTKEIDWKQLEIEAEVTLGGIRTKGDRMWLIDIPQSDVDKVVETLKIHVPTPKVLTSAEDKLQKIKDILNS